MRLVPCRRRTVKRADRCDRCGGLRIDGIPRHIGLLRFLILALGLAGQKADQINQGRGDGSLTHGQNDIAQGGAAGIRDVRKDHAPIEQIVYNLTDNAVKFSHHDSVIKIETAEKKNKIYVSVKDNGIGIPPEDVGMIFNRFYKSDASRGKDKKGKTCVIKNAEN